MESINKRSLDSLHRVNIQFSIKKKKGNHFSNVSLSTLTQTNFNNNVSKTQKKNTGIKLIFTLYCLHQCQSHCCVYFINVVPQIHFETYCTIEISLQNTLPF